VRFPERLAHPDPLPLVLSADPTPPPKTETLITETEAKQRRMLATCAGLEAELYRAAAVGYVTPLRDGMNLVAKEFVAAQEPAEPGVLLLSRFAGAAAELRDAVLTNPWHADGMTRDLDRALRMELAERQERHRRLLAVVSRTTATTWVG